MALTTYNITGNLEDALGAKATLGEVTFMPAGTTQDARVDGADAMLGPIRYSLADLPSPMPLTEGAWIITIRATGRVNGEAQFRTKTIPWNMTAATTWGAIVASAADPVPLPAPTFDESVAGVLGTGGQTDAALKETIVVEADPRKAWAPAADRPRQPVLGGLTNGTDTGLMSAFNMIATEDAGQVRVTYANYYSSDSKEVPGPNNVTVRCGIKYGTRFGQPIFWPVYFGGKRDVVIEPGTAVDSDPVFINMPKGATFEVRTYLTVASGGKWPYGVIQAQQAAFGDGVEQGTTVTDKTMSGTVTGSNNYAYGPTAIRTLQAGSASSVAIVGDSIAFGSGDGPQDHGYIYRGLRDDGLSVQHLGWPGGSAEHFTVFPEQVRHRLRLSEACSAAVVAVGTNDVNGSKTAQQVQDWLTNLATVLHGQGVRKVYVCTLPPRTTSTDSWATTAGQTVAATEPVRTAINGWIRTTRTGFDGYFDAADLLETARDSGIWKASHTSDGIHPNATGHAAAKAAIVGADLT